MSSASMLESSQGSWIGRLIATVKQRERLVLFAGAGLQVVILAALVVARSLPLATGETVLLRVVPVDPRDMFRGDYVTLGYDISRLTPDDINGTRPSELRGRGVYVTLLAETDGQHYKAGKVSLTRPSGGKFIRGTVDSRDRIVYGIESYYVQEGTGHDYEAAVRRGQLSAEVAVAPDGQAALRGLRIESRPPTR
jgi:uncharacterized membrane-anchored protein